jgi:hypothetical protein
VGGFAFFVVCGLLGAGFAVLGLHVYLIAPSAPAVEKPTARPPV